MALASRLRWKRFAGDRRGVAAVEMALAAPVLVLLLGGLIELSNYISVHYRTAQTSSTVADAIARYDMIGKEDIEGVLGASAYVMGSRQFSENGHIIVSGVRRNAGQPTPHIAWQCSGGGALEAESHVGDRSARATVPGDLEVATDDTLIITEVFYEYRPILNLGLIDPTVLWKTAVFRPRLGGLTTAAGC